MIGKWVMVDEGEYYQVGEVTALYTDYIFVRLRPPDPTMVPHYRLFHFQDLFQSMTFFFDTEAELDAFIASFEEGSEPKLKLVKLRGEDQA